MEVIETYGFLRLLLSVILFVVYAPSSDTLLITDDDTNYDLDQFVFLDLCRDKDTNFCNTKVENSVCNTEKNECFCKKGFVVIREGKKVICKPLLTDLTCRVDRDCVHVGGSMCHPGAGHCVCPSRHVFVPQIFVCRRKYESPLNEDRLCKMCRDNSGECFRYDFKDTRIFGSDETVGCSCGGNRAVVANEVPTSVTICAAKLVDVGYLCNNRDLICRSMKASCAKIYHLTYKCQCTEGHVPVFQANLRYHECFPIIEAHRKCNKCQQVGGQCYDTTSTNQPDGCTCPSSLSNLDNGLTSLTNPCSIKHLTSTCMEDKVKVCFLPYTLPPYESLKSQLRGNRASIFVRHPEATNLFDSGTPIQRDKLQIHSQMVQDLLYFCGFINTNEKGCPLRIKQVQNKIEYEGVIEIIRDSMKQDSATDVSMAFKCDREGRLVGHIDPGYADSLQLELRVLDSQKNTEVTNVYSNTPILLDVTLIDSRGFYTDMFVNHCSIHNSSINTVPVKEEEFIYQSCNNSSYKKHVLWKQIFPGIHYQTTPLLLSRTTAWQGEIFVQCQIYLCRSQQSCHHEECINPASQDHPTKSFYRSTKLVIVKRSKEFLENIMGVTEDVCPYSLCLNQLQAVMTSVLLLLLLFLVVILLTILFKRQKALQNFANSTKKTIPSNLTSYKASSDFINGNNQNFYLLTDNNSISNSIDNFEGSETTAPLRDNNNVGSSTFLQSDTYTQSGTHCTVPHFRMSTPYFHNHDNNNNNNSNNNNNLMLASFHTMPSSRTKHNEINVENNSYVSNDNLLKIKNDTNTDKKLVYSTPKCKEIICMCTE